MTKCIELDHLESHGLFESWGICMEAPAMVGIEPITAGAIAQPSILDASDHESY